MSNSQLHSQQQTGQGLSRSRSCTASKASRVDSSACLERLLSSAPWRQGVGWNSDAPPSLCDRTVSVRPYCEGVFTGSCTLSTLRCTLQCRSLIWIRHWEAPEFDAAHASKKSRTCPTRSSQSSSYDERGHPEPGLELDLLLLALDLRL